MQPLLLELEAALYPTALPGAGIRAENRFLTARDGACSADRPDRSVAGPGNLEDLVAGLAGRFHAPVSLAPRAGQST